MSINLNKSPDNLLDNMPLTKSQRLHLTAYYYTITKTLKLAIKESKANHSIAKYLKQNLPSVDKSYLYTVLLYLGYDKRSALHPFISIIYDIDAADLLTPRLSFAEPNKILPVDMIGRINYVKLI